MSTTATVDQGHGPRCGCMRCPYCGAFEVNNCQLPVDEWRWNIRPFKVDNDSHCTICNRWF